MADGAHGAGGGRWHGDRGFCWFKRGGGQLRALGALSLVPAAEGKAAGLNPGLLEMGAGSIISSLIFKVIKLSQPWQKPWIS